MKISRLGPAIALIFLVVYPSTSFAEWKKVSESVSGNTFYVDFESIKKNRGYVYYWLMVDWLKHNSYGTLSSKVLNEIDCNVPRKSRAISGTFYKGQISQGETTQVEINPKSGFMNPLIIVGKSYSL